MLILGVAIVAFPVYVTFIASTQTAEQIVQNVPMSLLPGGNMLESYRLALFGGADQLRQQAAAGGADDDGQPDLARWSSRIGKIAISLLSAFAIVYFRFPLRGLVLLDDLRDADAAGGGAHPADLQGGVRPRHAQHLRRPDGAADRIGDRDLPVPPVLPHRARRTGRGRAHRRRRPDALLQGRAGAAVDRPAIAALFVIQFIYGWNQYLWPLLVTTDESMYPIVMGIKRMIAGGDAATEWNVVMATAMLAMIPPALVVLLMQKWFVKGLVDTEK